MASIVDVCNLALGKLGDEGGVVSIDPPDNSQQAAYCALFYPQALHRLLVEHHWSLNTRLTSLAQVVNVMDTWDYAYALPSDWVNTIRVISDRQRVDEYDMLMTDDGYVLLCNVPSIELVYSSKTVDISRAHPLFIEALVDLLASYLAGPIIKGDTGVAAANKLLQSAMMTMGQARLADARNQQDMRNFSPSVLSHQTLTGLRRVAR